VAEATQLPLQHFSPGLQCESSVHCEQRFEAQTLGLVQSAVAQQSPAWQALSAALVPQQTLPPPHWALLEQRPQAPLAQTSPGAQSVARQHLAPAWHLPEQHLPSRQSPSLPQGLQA